MSKVIDSLDNDILVILTCANADALESTGPSITADHMNIVENGVHAGLSQQLVMVINNCASLQHLHWSLILHIL